MANQFVHLHLHSEYSLQDSTLRLKPLMQQVRERGMAAVALTDLNNMFAVVKHFKAAIAAGVKPIFGADVWIHHPDRTEPLSRLVLLCLDDCGYLNLKQLISRAYLEGQSADRPCIDIEWLRSASQGLIALSACLEGDVGLAIKMQNTELAKACLLQWREIFTDRYFLEIQRTGRQHEEAYIAQSVAWSQSLQVPLVASNDVRFSDAEDFDAHEVRVCICSGFTLEDERRPKLYSPQQYLRSNDEMIELFADIPEAIENTVAIATACNLRLVLDEPRLPEYPVPQGHSVDSFLRHVAEQGLEQRLAFLEKHHQQETRFDREPYYDRLRIELDVIIEMGFPGYFLIVMDFIEWARKHDIPVGPGRGSGAGSLVAYSLKITDLDPLAYELLFERFLNPERISMPDFDIDFCMNRRDEVIEYVSEHYGRNQVSQIITYGSMAAKAVIRDVGRVMSHPYGFVDRIAKLVPFEIGITLDKALQQEEALLQLYQQEEEVTMLIDMAKSLEGLTRNVGKHAGGVVISPSDLTDFTPLYCDPGGSSLVSQYDMDDVEAVGLVKFDFLGLRTLTIIDWAVKAINARHRDLGLEIERLPLDDSTTFKLLQAYQTTAVFQLESRGMKDLIRRLQPDSFEDIIALVALFRPGPLQSGMVDDFIDRKHGRSRVEYPHPALEAILQPTYGVILYQEQVMQIAQVLAGYTLGGADMLRRAMGKKKPEEMKKQRVVFTEGALANKVEAATATYIFDLMEKFAGYGFNKSHSAAYALISYQTAWLKTHYPAEFMAAVLSADMDNTDKIVTLIDECREMALEIQAPDINLSVYQFTAGEKAEVYYGLGAIKGVGQAAIECIIEGRADRAYQSLDDFCERVGSSSLSRKVLEALIKGGAMNCFSDNRAALMAHLPYALQSAEQQQNNLDAGISDMFESISPVNEQRELPTCDAWDEKTRLMQEKEALGLFLTGHPLAIVDSEVRQIAPVKLGQWLERLDTRGNGSSNGNGNGNGRYRQKEQATRVCGLVVDIRMRNSFKGREAFVTLDDRSGRVDVRVAPEMLAEIDSIVEKDQVWVVDGGIAYDDFNNGIKLRASRVQLLDDYRCDNAKALHITLNGHGDEVIDTLINDLNQCRAKDSMPVVFHLRHQDYRYQLRTKGDWSFKPDEKFLVALQRYLDKDEYYFEYS